MVFFCIECMVMSPFISRISPANILPHKRFLVAITLSLYLVSLIIGMNIVYMASPPAMPPVDYSVQVSGGLPEKSAMTAFASAR